jgi:hypothetical protein
LFQGLKKSCVVGALFRIVQGHEYGNPPHPLALLGSGRQRPCHSGGSQLDELAPFHCSPGSLS